MLYPQLNISRDLLCLDGFWEFVADKDNSLSDEQMKDGTFAGRDIAVPASWNDQYEDLFHFFGKGWYKKESFIPLSWSEKNIFIRFGSVSTKARVFINGIEAISHIGTALPFEVCISEYVKYGQKNMIVVLSDNTLDPWGLPPATLTANEGRVGFANSYPAVTYDFFPFGGIHRSVYLYTINKKYIKDITVKTTHNKDCGTVSVDILLSDKVTGTLNIKTDDKEFNFNLSDVNSFNGQITIDNPKLWDIGQPNLYSLEANIIENNNVMDSYELEYGIRTVRVVGEKLYLNDKEVFFKGFGKHEDFHVIGKGFSHSVTIKDFGLLKWIGANSFRTSHYPYDEQILSLADKEGFLVIGETPFVGLNERNYTDKVLDKAVDVIKEMIQRDKNHPSIIMWSLANEPNPHCKEADNFFKTMAETAKKMDDTRPITYVAHIEPEDNEVIKYFDIICVNKYYGWYIMPGQIDESLEEFSKCLDKFHDKYKKGLILTEFGADAIAGMHTNPPQMFTEEYQAEIIKKQYEVLKSKSYAVGAHVWAFADFKTAQTISRIVFNRKGVFTREREPKMAAHMLKELWSKE